jgi:hypothetical protein
VLIKGILRAGGGGGVVVTCLRNFRSGGFEDVVSDVVNLLSEISIY